MRKVWKLILTISLSIACVGVMFCVAGAVMGGSSEEMEELLYNAGVSRYVRIVGARIVEQTYYEGYHHDEGHGDHYEYTDYGVYEEEFWDSYDYDEKYDGIDELKMEVPAMDVYVLEREDDEEDVHVMLYDVPEKLRDALKISQDGGKLKIETKDSKSLKEWLKDEGYYGTLYIEIPREAELHKASLEVGAGNLYVDNIRADELDVEVGAGEVNISQFVASKVELQCGTGNAYLSGMVSKEIEIECGVGSVTFCDSGRESDYEYKLDCGIGNLNVGAHSYSGLGGTREIKGGNATKKMKIECGIGNVEVYFMED